MIHGRRVIISEDGSKRARDKEQHVLIFDRKKR